MLPHILHSTTRAAAVVQNQTHNLWNVLQLPSSSSGSGSNRGNGPGPGGPKYNPGSRFFSGYNNAGRAVTQANVLTSQDGTVTHSDEVEELTPRRTLLPAAPQKRPRMRSSSVSLGVADRDERGENLGVLQTVQRHARSRHVFAPVETLASAKQRLLADPVPAFDDVVDTASRPLLVRRNSTSAPLSPLLDDSPLPPLTTPPSESLNSESIKRQSPVSSPKVEATDPNQPQTVTPPPTPPEQDYFVSRFNIANDPAFAGEFARRMLQQLEKPTLEQFNAGLMALIRTRPEGESLNKILRLYNAMLDKDVVPNAATYEALIHAFTTRDYEIQRAITALELRVKQYPLLGRVESASLAGDRDRIASLREEDNFSSAMTLLESILAIDGGQSLPAALFVKLLKSCSLRGNVDAAIHIYAQLEARKIKPEFAVYRYMIETFSNAGRIKDAEEVFAECLRNGKAGKAPKVGHKATRTNQLKTWNSMIEAYFRAGLPDKAVELVDQMVNSQAGDQYGPGDVPVTTSSTFTTVIGGFIHSGDIQSALSWFERLLQQERAPSNPYDGLGGKAMRPDPVAWGLMLDALAMNGQIDELNRLYKLLATTHKGDAGIRPIDRQIVFGANMQNLKNLDNDAALSILNFLLEDVVHSTQSNNLLEIFYAFISRGQYVTATNLFREHLTLQLSNVSPGGSQIAIQQLQYELMSFASSVFASAAEGLGELPIHVSLDISRLFAWLSLKPPVTIAPYFLHSYGLAHRNSLIPFGELAVQDWNLLLEFAVQLESAHMHGTTQGLTVVPDFAFNGVVSLLQDIAAQGVSFDILDPEVTKRTLELLQAQFGGEQTQQILTGLGPSYINAWSQFDQLRYAALESALTQEPLQAVQAVSSQMAVKEYPTLAVNSFLTRSIDQVLRSDYSRGTLDKIHKAYQMFEEGVQKGTAPQPNVLARLITNMGRINELDRVRELYTVAQSVLNSLSRDRQLNAWVMIEDSMVVALAHSGNVDAAHVHRLRVLEQGRSLSADAYGVLIQYVRDTTDDTSGAMALFQEAIERGVKPNLYLYNNIISKLSKARKADHALELFQQMKASDVTPSSITYGAVIGACARVGDVASAENLFQEMMHSRGFKPRVPPYNTMIQLHTTTKPSRHQAIYYYDQLLQAGIKPSAHTYKLLLDAYGSIEPVDLASMERVFQNLQNDASVDLTGPHFASLINAYGCVTKDLSKALSIFESMPTIPRAPAPDAVVYEAVINAIVAHKRTDLIPVYISKMSEQGVHMTAYIANFLIKGYANVGDMHQARDIFESLADPPSGVAAPNNHVPHPGQANANGEAVDVMEPVYREPSTWEVMVRAELGAGNRDAAVDLLERLRERQYPEAVYNRISGVMTDHSDPSTF